MALRKICKGKEYFKVIIVSNYITQSDFLSGGKWKLADLDCWRECCHLVAVRIATYS